MIERRLATSPAACALLAGPPPILILPGSPTSARHARTFVREYVRCHVPYASPEYIDNVVLVTCELVTNSIRYGTEPGDSLRVSLDASALRTMIEVQDPVRRRPRARPESSERERGRGLVVLDALCRAWGVEERPFGKAVWAEVAAS
ncbi:ATP-binding protein [Streptomyces sp. NPDC047024]|uniref:ATP-binding protein n=1 Tax=Streptomyces sp. NPDC047024 TaxID=3155476 RepID=UPI00340877FA